LRRVTTLAFVRTVLAKPCFATEVAMAKEELLEFEGVVTDVLPEGRYRVRLVNDHELIAYTAGRMKKNKIRTLVGDRVTVEVSPYDLDRGRLMFRHKEQVEAAGGRRAAPRKFIKRK
jgi:translation initiation factor IF-1